VNMDYIANIDGPSANGQYSCVLMRCDHCPEPKGIANLGRDWVFECSRGHRIPLADQRHLLVRSEEPAAAQPGIPVPPKT
jgi:hypothetical protein